MKVFILALRRNRNLKLVLSPIDTESISKALFRLSRISFFAYIYIRISWSRLRSFFKEMLPNPFQGVFLGPVWLLRDLIYSLEINSIITPWARMEFFKLRLRSSLIRNLVCIFSPSSFLSNPFLQSESILRKSLDRFPGRRAQEILVLLLKKLVLFLVFLSFSFPSATDNHANRCSKHIPFRRFSNFFSLDGIS
jgi:hypothetical protein